MNKPNKQLVKAKETTIVQDEATSLIAQAITKGVDVGTMEKLLAMRRELKQERAKEDFDRAMATFQSECPTIEKKVQGYNYKYADLTSIIEQVKTLLSKNGFSYTFDTDDVENAIVVYCKVKHISGHMEVSKSTITRETTTKMNASQQSGAAMTYGKRYAFCNAFGILTGDEDKDGVVAHPQHKDASEQSVVSGRGYTVTPTPEQPLTPVMATYTQKMELRSLQARAGKTRDDMENAIHYLSQGKKATIAELTVQEAETLLKRMRTLPEKKGDQVQVSTPAEVALNIDEIDTGIAQMQHEETPEK